MKLTYGIPLWLMKEYLSDLGATETAENTMTAAGWQAVVDRGEPVKIGSLVVGRVDVTFSGDQEAITDLLEKLHWKTLRGGG